MDVLYEHIEGRWEEDGEAYDRTYLRYVGAYYGISLVKDGDWVAVDSTP